MILFSRAQLGILCFSKLYLSYKQNMWDMNWLRSFSKWESHGSSDHKTQLRKYLFRESSQFENHSHNQKSGRTRYLFNTVKGDWKTEPKEKSYKFALWNFFSKFHHKLSNLSSGIYEIAKNKWSKVLAKIFHKKIWWRIL